ncbi:DUF4333 domain-containing protein [Brachybacterium sp. FME24]|uniref:DUF4333 domain-containing protein n=1 Tax=Brachybacterium sp. FME24 TaxID=2742605 RepID=UPI001866C2AD|nr:DUF4333 domain-containing protein [Brachybacterium sp. FME24]
MSTTRLRSVVRPLALTAAATFALAGCGLLGAGSLPADEVETKISEQLTAQVGQEPDEVSCPEDLPAEEGAEMTCELTADGESIDVMVTVTAVEDDTVNFDIEVADEAN